MSESSERYRRVAAQFTRRVEAVPVDRWDSPSPCEGWKARDVVAHLCEWLPAFFVDPYDLDRTPIPSVDDDPVASWTALDNLFQHALDDPEIAGRVRDTHMGAWTFEQTVDTICTPDVLIHTWDLARAVGLDEQLDPDEVHRMLGSVMAMGDALQASGHYGPPTAVADSADEQTRLLAFLGRRP